MDALVSIYVNETRYNLYAMIHKGLRRAQTDLLGRIGALDVADDGEVGRIASDMQLLTRLGRKHLAHENLHIHGVIEARLPGATERLVDDHDHHERDFDEIEIMLSGLVAADVEARPPLARKLYLRYAKFIAEDFGHMLEEETTTLSQLHSLFSDADLQAIEMAIIGSVEPETMLHYLRIMVPAMNPAERIGMIGGMQAGMPAPVFAAVVDAAIKPVLPEAQFRALAAALRFAA